MTSEVKPEAKPEVAQSWCLHTDGAWIRRTPRVLYRIEPVHTGYLLTRKGTDSWYPVGVRRTLFEARQLSHEDEEKGP